MIKNFEEFKIVNEQMDGRNVNPNNYNIDNKTVEEGSLGPEFDEWYKNCNEKAKENNWASWQFVHQDKSSDPNQTKIIFLVTVKQFDSKNERSKGIFDLQQKKGKIVD